MAFNKISIDKNNWILIGDNVSEITFQNVGQFGFYINFTSSTTPPTDEYGLVYPPDMSGEMKKPLVDMTQVTSPAYVWAKAISQTTNIIVEQ